MEAKKRLGVATKRAIHYNFVSVDCEERTILVGCPLAFIDDTKNQVLHMETGGLTFAEDIANKIVSYMIFGRGRTANGGRLGEFLHQHPEIHLRGNRKKMWNELISLAALPENQPDLSAQISALPDKDCYLG